LITVYLRLYSYLSFQITPPRFVLTYRNFKKLIRKHEM